ncbi:MAG: AAA family ATPase [Nitrospiraceae bacterium]
MDKFKLPTTLLAPVIDPEELGFEQTGELTPLDETIGQERAVEALEFGLHMKSPGFNLYVAGPAGTGKASLVRRMVQRMAREEPPPPDWCYVNNFQDPSQPTKLRLPPGQGRVFSHAMAVFVQSLRRDIPATFESKPYLDAKAKIQDETEAKKKALFRELHEFGREHGFGFEELPMGFGLVPLKSGHPMTEEEVEQLSDQERRSLNEQRKAIESEIREFQIRIHALDQEAERRLLDLDRKVVQTVMEDRFAAVRQPYQTMPDIGAYLDRVHEDVVARYRDFLPKEKPALPFLALDGSSARADLTRYQVNVLVEHGLDQGAPVVDESHPTYANLVGKIERKAHMGVMYTDFTEIKAGALLQASGGYLILNTVDLLRQPFSWDALKRILKTGQVTIEDASEFFGFSTIGLKPEPIPIDVKVILVGPPIIYHLLQAYEEDFHKIFKVKADFDVDIERSEQQDRQYARFIARICCDERLPHFSKEAVAAVIRQGFRLAERHDRLSLRFSLLSDLIREAGFWAQREGRRLVTDVDVEAAIDHKRRRSSLAEQWIQDEIREGTLLVDVDGDVVGQVNGLSVHLLGDYSFGRPCRITARVSVGTKGIIDIQREAELAGHVHSKGVLTLAGYLAGKFAGTHPFALNATLTFEQTYSEVEGDSAAAAELIAILSSLAEVPVKQSFAITGSVNQLGEIQPIGGVNEKIEGFFETCRRRGLTGRQGVIIPARNIKHLALRPEVVRAVEAGTFAVYGVNSVEEAVELMTGLAAGERDQEGFYQEDSLFGRVDLRMEELAQIVASWGEMVAKTGSEPVESGKESSRPAPSVRHRSSYRHSTPLPE